MGNDCILASILIRQVLKKMLRTVHWIKPYLQYDPKDSTSVDCKKKLSRKLKNDLKGIKIGIVKEFDFV